MLSVIIPVYNSENTIEECLKSLEKQTLAKKDYEIIVVDDGSTDATASLIRNYEVKLFSQENQGPAAARNYGVSKAQGEIIFFIDADCIAFSDWLEQMLYPFSDKEVVGVKGIYSTRQKELTSRFVQLEYEQKYERMKKFSFIDFIDTYSAAFRKDVFLKYGGYDTSFPSASVEDQEFSFRLANNGCKMVFQPAAKVFHQHKSSLRDYFRRKFYIAYWKIKVLYKHPGKITGDSHTPQLLKFQILLVYAILAFLFAGFFSNKMLSGGLIGLIVFLLTTLPFISFALMRDPAVALVSPALLLLRSSAFCVGLLGGVLSKSWKNK